MKKFLALAALLLCFFQLFNCGGKMDCETSVSIIDSLSLTPPPLGLQVYPSIAALDIDHQDRGLALIGYNDRQHALDISTDLADEKARSIRLEKDGPRAIPEVYYLLTLNPDTLALFSRDQISLVNPQGDLIEKISTRARSDSTSGTSGFVDYEPYLSSDRSLHGYFHSPTGDLLVPLNHIRLDPFSFPAAYATDVHLLGKINIHSQQSSLLPVYYPDRFRENFYGLLASPIVNFIDENEVIYGFLGFPEIYKVDLRSGQVTVSKPACQNCTGLPPPYTGASGDPLDTENYLRSYTRYVNLVWSLKEEILYRFFLTPIPDRPNKSELFVSIHDRELNYLGESKVPGGIMYFGGVPSREGWFFPKLSDEEGRLLLVALATSNCE